MERLVAVDLVEREVPELAAVVADVRELPFEPGTFDQVLLVSTLEHVGADNTVYGVAASAPAVRRKRWRSSGGAAREGSLCWSACPRASPADHGWFRQDAPAGWLRLFAGRLLRRGAGGLRADRRAGWRANPWPAGRRSLRRARIGCLSAVLCAERPRRLRRLVAPSGLAAVARRRLGPTYARLVEK